MTASSGTQIARKNAAMSNARDKVANEYGNNQLNTDFSNWLSSGGYDNIKGNSNYGIHKSKGSHFNQAGMRDDMINDFEDESRKNIQNYMDQNFAGYGGSNGWLDNYWKSGASDDLVNNFVNTNYDNAIGSLDRALKRGTLSQSGYDSALSNLNTQKSGAMSTIGDIGSGIIDDYRADLNNKVAGYKTDLDNYNLHNYNSLSPDAIKGSFDDMYNQQQQGLEGKFNLMTQDIKPFDVAGLIGDARVDQGVNNTQSDQLLGAIEDTERQKDKKVGLGNVGLF